MTTQQQTTQETAPPPALGEAGFTPAAHSDDAELSALEAQLAAGGQGAEDEPEAIIEEEQTQDAPATTQQQEAPAAGAKPAMVPHSRFHEVNVARQQAEERARALELQLAEAKGFVTALAAGKAPAAATPQATEPTPQERLTALENEFATLAEKYESGELSTKDYEVAKLGVTRQINRIERELDQPIAAQAQGQDTYLQEKTDALTTEFPVLASLSAKDIEAIVPLARRNAEREGVVLDTDLKLRRYVAATANKFYGGATNDQQTSAGGKPQATSPNPAAANGLAKIELAKRAPPNLNTIASQGPAPGGVPTAEQFDAMSEDARAALPDAVLAQMAKGGR